MVSTRERLGARRHHAVVEELLLLFAAAVLFALSFPNPLSKWGFFPLAYFAIAPLMLMVHKSSWLRLLAYGPAFGFLSYALFNVWLINWNPLAIFVVPSIHAAYFLVLLPILKLIDCRLPRNGFLLQALVWVGYEYLKTLGFLGYPYGIIGYTQTPFLPLIQIASLAGVWGVSLIVILPSTLLAAAATSGWSGLWRSVCSYRLPALIYAVVLVGAISFGLFGQIDTRGLDGWKIALIQQNVDPWKGGNQAYRTSLDVVTRLSRKALAAEPDIDTVIWSETSFVPSIDWHTRYRTDSDRYSLVKRLRDFLDSQPVSYVIGNNDGQKRRLLNGEEIRVDYNAALLYRDGQIVDTYRKMRLVPFSENFPYRGALTWFYELLLRFDIHHYEAGTKPVVFEDRGVRFATPICYEDTFGDIGRMFVREGADVLVNMTNDSWARSVSAQMQHLNMGVFRAVENRRSVVRSTNSGMTAIIDPNGRVVSMLPPFEADYLIDEVTIGVERITFYSRWGDWLGKSALVAGVGAGLALLFWGMVKRMTRMGDTS